MVESFLMLTTVVQRTKLWLLFSPLAEIDYEDDDIECNLPLLDGAVLSATSYLNERGPQNARLNGEFTHFVCYLEHLAHS